MVTGISGSGNSLFSLYAEQLRAKEQEEEQFTVADDDGDGGLNAEELESVLSTIASQTGATLNVDDSIATYDTDNDSLLSLTETEEMMRTIIEEYGAPQSQANVSQAMSAYMANSESDLLSSLLSKLSASEVQPPPPPPPSPEEKFAELDADSSDGIDVDELAALTEEIAGMTGEEMDAEETLLAYDTDDDAVLSQTELDSLMADLHAALGPPPRWESGDSLLDVVNSYLGSDDVESDTVDQLISILNTYAENNTSDTSDSVDESA